MSEPPVIDQPTEETAEVEERLEYEVKKGSGLVVHLAKPNEAQMMVLVRMVDLLEDAPVDAVRLYGDALEKLMEPGEGFRCQRALLSGKIEIEDFVEMGPAVLRHFYPEQASAATAPTNGPVATRRPKKNKR